MGTGDWNYGITGWAPGEGPIASGTVVLRPVLNSFSQQWPSSGPASMRAVAGNDRGAAGGPLGECLGTAPVRRSYFDDGTPWIRQERMQIDAIPQAWAVISASRTRRWPDRRGTVSKGVWYARRPADPSLRTRVDMAALQPLHQGIFGRASREKAAIPHAATWVVAGDALQGDGTRALAL